MKVRGVQGGQGMNNKQQQTTAARMQDAQD
jgi:hypothetical protein